MKLISMRPVMYLFVWGEACAGESVETQTSHQLIFVCGNIFVCGKMASDSPPVLMHLFRGLGDKLPRRSVCGTMAMINIKQEA